MLTVLRAADHKQMPWKNGGGTTTEIAVYPEGADLASFGWRVSMATVATDGAFSLFPEIDRTLSILDGDGMELNIDGRSAITLTQAAMPLRFAADRSTVARLLSGPIVDLNIMSRRGKWQHHVERIGVQHGTSIEKNEDVALLLSLGDVQVESHGQIARLSKFDAAFLYSSTARLQCPSPCDVFVIRLTAHVA